MVAHGIPISQMRSYVSKGGCLESVAKWGSEFTFGVSLCSVMKLTKLPRVTPVRDVCVKNTNACFLAISRHTVVPKAPAHPWRISWRDLLWSTEPGLPRRPGEGGVHRKKVLRQREASQRRQDWRL